MLDGVAGFPESLARGVELAIEEAVGNLDEEFMQAMQQVQKSRRDNDDENPRGEPKVFLNVA